MRNMEKQNPESIFLTFGVPLTKSPLGNISLLLSLLLRLLLGNIKEGSLRGASLIIQGLDYSGIDIDFGLKMMVLLLTVVVPPSGT